MKRQAKENEIQHTKGQKIECKRNGKQKTRKVWINKERPRRVQTSSQLHAPGNTPTLCFDRRGRVPQITALRRVFSALAQ